MEGNPMRFLRSLLLILSALILGAVLFLGRDSMMTGALLLSKNAYLPRFLDKAYLVVFGMLWLLGWVLVEGYYVEGERKKILWPRFLRVTGIELILVFCAHLLSTLRTESGVNWAILALLVLALAAGAGLLVYSRRLLANAPKSSARGDWTTGLR
jgi:hypothetical protein